MSPTWLNGFDPSSAASIAASLKALLPAKSTSSTTALAPAGFNILNPSSLKPKAPAPPSKWQQALAAFKVAGDTYLIQSALSSYQPIQQSAPFGSAAAFYNTLNSTAQTILAAGKSGNYGNINALA